VLRIDRTPAWTVARVRREQPDTDVHGHFTVVGVPNGNDDAKLRAALHDAHRGVGPRGALP
jgi:hypothetical protein